MSFHSSLHELDQILAWLGGCGSTYMKRLKLVHRTLSYGYNPVLARKKVFTTILPTLKIEGDKRFGKCDITWNKKLPKLTHKVIDPLIGKDVESSLVSLKFTNFDLLLNQTEI